MPDIPHLVIALAIGTGIIMLCLAVAVGVILLASKHPATFAEVVPQIIDRIVRRGWRTAGCKFTVIRPEPTMPMWGQKAASRHVRHPSVLANRRAWSPRGARNSGDVHDASVERRPSEAEG
jgi:hypothetical protein